MEEDHSQVQQMIEQLENHSTALLYLYEILAGQEKRMDLMNKSILQLNQSLDIIIKQSFLLSHRLSIPSAFKGIKID